MNDLIFSINIVFPIFFIILLGMFLEKIGMLPQEFRTKASKLVFYVALPISLFKSVATSDIRQSFSVRFIAYALGASCLILFLSWIVTSLCIHDRATIGAVIHGSYRGNYAYIGLAIIHSILGKDNVIPSVLIVIFVIPLYNILATIILTIFGSKDSKISIKELLINVIKNPLIIGIVLAIPFSLFSIPMPSAMNTVINYLAQMSTPLALILVGGNLHLKTISAKIKPIIIATTFKIVISPLLGTFLAVLFGITGEELVTLYVLFAVPSAVNTYIMAQNMDGDADVAAGIVMATTIFSTLTMTLGIFILRRFLL